MLAEDEGRTIQHEKDLRFPDVRWRGPPDNKCEWRLDSEGRSWLPTRKWKLQSYNHRTWILPITWMSQEATLPLSLELSPANVWSSPWWYPAHRPCWSPPALWLQNCLLIAWVLFEKQQKLGSNARVRASLVTQWSRIHLPMQETWIWFLIQEDPTKLQLLSLCSKAWEPQMLSLHALERMLSNRGRHHNEKLVYRNGRVAPACHN